MSDSTSMRYHLDIADMTAGTRVDGAYALVNPQVALKRDGEPYLKCILRDATGDISARLWSITEERANEIAATGFVWIRGATEKYKEQIQLKIEEIDVYQPDDADLATLLPHTKHDVDAMFARLRELIDSFSSPLLRALGAAYLDDEAIATRLRRAPAAINLHHAFIGGLLEHTLQLMELAEAMLPRYPELNRDVVLMGLFLHDLGKMFELQWERGFDYTRGGNLIGHIVMGVQLLDAKRREAEQRSGERFDMAQRHVLEHIILSHHGKLEFGAAKLPATPEAIFIALLDNLDAKTTMSIAAADRDNAKRDEEFTERIWALETRVFRPDPFAP